ncbi:MAG TPA: MFS transporter, partial [Chthonomonadales bacterium]|nr:MFS transporter [Chthonomonadales bacterium]
MKKTTHSQSVQRAANTLAGVADKSQTREMQTAARKSAALKFVVMVGALSFFADFTYEGSRSILGPYLALLQASATTVGIVTGFGELLGYTLRLVSGRAADRTGQFWPITIFGYVVQMCSVPALAVAGNWPTAAVLIIVERVGKAIRNPPRDVMLSHAAKEIGYGWAFGVHEALDQSGALFGPLLVAAVLAWGGDYRFAFATLLLPGLMCLSLLLIARWLYPRPEELAGEVPN